MPINSGQLYPIGYLPTASDEQLGVVQPQDGLTTTPEGVLTVSFATTETIGGVIVGEGLEITPEGLLSAVGGASFELETVSLVTPTITPGENLVTSLEISESFLVVQVTTSSACRVRAYNNTDYQAADVSRGLVTKIDVTTLTPALNEPEGDHGVLLETRSTASYLNIRLSPAVLITLIPSNTFVPITVTNLSDSATAITIDFLIIRIV